MLKTVSSFKMKSQSYWIWLVRFSIKRFYLKNKMKETHQLTESLKRFWELRWQITCRRQRIIQTQITKSCLLDFGTCWLYQTNVAGWKKSINISLPPVFNVKSFFKLCYYCNRYEFLVITTNNSIFSFVQLLWTRLFGETFLIKIFLKIMQFDRTFH